MIVKLLTEHHLEFLSLKGGCTGSSDSTLVKKSNCWKSYAAAHVVPFNESQPLFGIPGKTTLELVTYLVTRLSCSKFGIFIFIYRIA